MVDNGGTEYPGGRAFGKEGRILFSLCGAFQEHQGSVISSHSETVIEPHLPGATDTVSKAVVFES